MQNAELTNLEIEVAAFNDLRIFTFYKKFIVKFTIWLIIKIVFGNNIKF